MKKRHDVLVLNRSWVPIHIVDWTEAMSQIFQGKSRAIDHSDYIAYSYEDWLKFSLTTKDFYMVKCSEYSIALPEIIVLVKYDSIPDAKVKYSRDRVFVRDKKRCAYCGNTFATKDLTADHIIPKALGGKAVFDNIVTSCFPCNQKKACRTPAQAGMKLLFKPHKPQWFDPATHAHSNMRDLNSWKHFMKRVN